jgi:tetratricopeptide (TPR) repeat protein
VDAASAASGDAAEAKLRRSLSRGHERLADFDIARKVAEQAEALGDAAGDTRAGVDGLLRRARLSCRLGDVRTAEALLDDRLGGTTYVDEESMSLLLTARATIEVCAGTPESALALLDRSFAAARSSGSTAGKGHALSTVGLVYTLTGEYQTARELLGRAALLHQRTQDLESLGKTYNNIGVAYWLDKGRFASAIPFLERGLDFVAARDDLLLILNSLNNNNSAATQHYDDPPRIFRERFSNLVEQLTEPNMGRLTDQTVIAVGPAPAPRDKSFEEEPLHTAPVLFASVPSALPARADPPERS